MSVEEVKLLTAEPTDIVEARHHNKERLLKLRSALKVCNKHMYKLGRYRRRTVHGRRLMLEQVTFSSLGLYVKARRMI